MEELRLLTEKLIEREKLENCGQLYDLVSEEVGIYLKPATKKKFSAT